MSNTKGISPLFATIILILLSIGLGAIVMSWGETYVEGHAGFVQGVQEVNRGCDMIELSVIPIAGVPQLCSALDFIEVWLDNGPNMAVEDIHTRIVGTDGVAVIDSILNQPLGVAQAARLTIAFEPVGEVRQLKLTPKIRIGQDIIFCSDHPLIFENIAACAP